MMKRLLNICLATVLLGAAPLAAQQQQPPPRPERPYRGLFGGGVGDAEQLLTLNMSLATGYDDDILAGNDSTPGSGIGDPRQSQAGTFGAVSGRLEYSFSRTRAGIDASAGTSARYYPDLGDVFGSHSGSVGTFFQLARNTRLAANHTTTYQPFLTLSVFPQLFDTPGRAVPPNQELGIDRSDYLNHTSGISVTQDLTRRAAVSGNYNRHVSDFGDVERDFASQTGGGGVTIGLARGLDFRAGYGYTQARYDRASSDPYQSHNIDIGVQFDRRLSFSRRTRVSFGTGTMVMVDRDRSSIAADGDLPDRDRKVYRMNGHARLSHEIGRTWLASVAYDRDANFLETVAEPVFSDAVIAAFGGMVNQRVQLQSSVAASFGEFALTQQDSGFDTYLASVGLTVGLTRNLGLGANYSLYRYSFDPNALLPPGLSREIDRQSLQAYLTLWVPLVHRSRRPDAAR